MITTVTLNAAIDKLYLVEDMKPDTVMRVQKVQNTAGGKGLNVSKVAALAGERVRATGFVGGYNGAYLRAMLQQAGIEDAFTESGAETRSCINIRNLATGLHTEFLEPGAPVGQAEVEAFWEQYLNALQDSDVVTISGSVPPGVKGSLYSRMIRAARAAGTRVLLDTSGELLAQGAHAQPTMIKPNQDELGQLLGAPASSHAALLEAARRLHRDGIAYVALTLGAAGTILVCGEGAFHAKPPPVPVVNTVGCGDSMLAGFAVGMARGYGAEEMLAYATAVAASNALSVQTGCIVPAEIPALQRQVLVKPMKR